MDWMMKRDPAHGVKIVPAWRLRDLDKLAEPDRHLIFPLPKWRRPPHGQSNDNFGDS